MRAEGGFEIQNFKFINVFLPNKQMKVKIDMIDYFVMLLFTSAIAFLASMSISFCICNKLSGSGVTGDETGEVAGEEARLFNSGSLKSNLSSFFRKSFPKSERLLGETGALARLGVISGRSLNSSSNVEMSTEGDESNSAVFFDREGTIFFKKENMELRREDLAFAIAVARASAPNTTKPLFSDLL